MIPTEDRPFQRLMDVVAATSGLVLLSPVLVGLAVLVWVTSRGPVLYRSTRLGRHGRPFVLLKFRSMRVGSPPRILPDGSLSVGTKDPRLTPIGRFLRTGLDELPQLLNVLRGDMSLVGPRPDLPHAMELYTQVEARRLKVRPGITGLAQVSGRTAIPWRDRLALDVEYVSTRSLALDVRILFATVLELVPPLRRALRGVAPGAKSPPHRAIK